ncbi:hypothetical protein K435DRAFT_965177 [Dendrothele bispora CBS 962.96]|uniref:Uncharacterized protein n=1 Tax=Dendrothele bispora (strain CBS 962.96) TaxID=1314807 RepID=A0A4S8M6K7_DENBC|nr:hypothetical protein K435DRAFT_965177 [Dendrothele bispora CBS 962.96]
MTTPATAIPFLSGLVLTETQLRILADYYLPSGAVDNLYSGDPVYAINSTWQDLNKPNSILPLMDTDFTEKDPRCFLYILDVVPSYDGKPPKPNFSSKHLTWMWKKLGKPPAWENVKFVVRRWPRDPGLPEPQWLYERMFSKMPTDSKASQLGSPQA